MRCETCGRTTEMVTSTKPRYQEGDQVWFWPGLNGQRKHRRPAVFKAYLLDDIVSVILSNDPFSVCVYLHQIAPQGAQSPSETEGEVQMSSSTEVVKPTTKELRRQAKTLKVEGWEDMGPKALTKAIKDAGGKVKVKAAKSAAAPEKAASKKADKTEATEGSGESGQNPFKEGTNLWHITEEIFKGGKRSAMVKRLKKKITLNPRDRAGEDFDEDYQLDRRILIVGQILRKDHGFDVVRDGRSAAEGTICIAD